MVFDTLYILMLGAPVYFLFTSKQDFLKITFIMFNGMTFCLLMYLLFPTGLQLRPEITGDNLLCRIADILYAIDTPTNVCPSIHVSSSVAAAICLLTMDGKAFPSEQPDNCPAHRSQENRRLSLNQNKREDRQIVKL